MISLVMHCARKEGSIVCYASQLYTQTIPICFDRILIFFCVLLMSWIAKDECRKLRARENRRYDYLVVVRSHSAQLFISLSLVYFFYCYFFDLRSPR